MCCTYFIPFILRPYDFLRNILRYTVGMLTYLFMLPTFTNIMSIYSMCNLHDISWGNRPETSQGVETITYDKKI